MKWAASPTPPILPEQGSLQETIESIAVWANETFGEAPSELRIATRANEEMAELLKAASTDTPNAKIIEEAADVAIVLSRLAHKIGIRVRWRIMGQKPGGDLPRLYFIVAARRLSEMMLHIDLGLPYANQLPQIADALACGVWILGGNLEAEIDRKMAINRQRRWNVGPDGHGYHVKEDAV